MVAATTGMAWWDPCLWFSWSCHRQCAGDEQGLVQAVTRLLSKLVTRDF